MKKIGTILGFDIKLTTYSARQLLRNSPKTFRSPY